MSGKSISIKIWHCRPLFAARQAWCSGSGDSRMRSLQKARRRRMKREWSAHEWYEHTPTHAEWSRRGEMNKRMSGESVPLKIWRCRRMPTSFCCRFAGGVLGVQVVITSAPTDEAE